MFAFNANFKVLNNEIFREFSGLCCGVTKIKPQNRNTKGYQSLFKVVLQGSQPLTFQNSAPNCKLLKKFGNLNELKIYPV